MTSQTLPLNLIPKGVCPRIYVSQYDKGQEWNFDIYAGTEAYTIPSGSTVTIQGTKPDKTGFQYACSFSGNRVTATEQQQMTIIAGEVPAEIRIEKNNEIIATLNFIIAVEKAALADDTVISETDLPLIEEAIEVLGHADELVERIEGDVTTSGNNALKAEGFAVGQQNGSDVASGSPYYHNSAKYYKEQAADSASTASNKASDASGSASAASGSASSASANALKAEGFAVGQQNGADVASGSPYYHNSAKYYKEQAADSASTASTKAGEAAASAQAAAQSAAHLTIDSAMSTTSQNAVQNKVVTGEINSVKETLTNYVKSASDILSAKNMCPTMTVDANSNSMVTVNKDGIVTFSGTATTRNSAISSKILLSAGKYIIGGCPSGGAESTYRLVIIEEVGNNTTYEFDYGTPIEVTLAVETNITLRADVYSGQTVSNLTFTPFIVPKEVYVLNPDYVPYAMTNRELTTDKVGMDLLSEVGAVNALKNTLAVGTTVDATSGLTYTVDSDGVVTVVPTSGTYPFTTTGRLQLEVCRKPVFPYLPCKLMGCPEGGTDYIVGYCIYYANWSNANGVAYDNGSGAIISEQFDYSSYPNARIAINIASGTVLTKALVFKPQIAPPDYNGPYVPYAKTNKELTDVLSQKFAVVTGTLVNGNVTPSVPSGFTAENSVVISSMVKATDSRWYMASASGIDTANNRAILYPQVWWDGNTGLRVLNYMSDLVGRPYKLCLMRTDI